MHQPGKHWFGRHRTSRPSRRDRRRTAGRRLEGNKNEGSNVREELVDRVRQEITAGTYDTLMKMEAAFERLLVQIAHD
jgi:hypothetical protein